MHLPHLLNATLITDFIGQDDLFSFAELQLLSELVAKHHADRWGMVASRFFDKTGRRVHPDDVRDKFMGL